ncbi:MAG: winged helix-turn-helix domain-containing protein, partial [Pseudonocardiaceae bacterium]
IRLHRGPEFAIGPGKVALLEAVKETGSISAAGRMLGMSYSRAWKLIAEMNRCFRQVLVETATGGNRGGGAAVTKVGEAVIDRYRDMEARVSAAIAEDLASWRKLIVR